MAISSELSYLNVVLCTMGGSTGSPFLGFHPARTQSVEGFSFFVMVVFVVYVGCCLLFYGAKVTFLFRFIKVLRVILLTFARIN